MELEFTITGRRLELARALAAGRFELPRLEHTTLRFSHGTSLADLRVPYHATGEVQRILTKAGRQLVQILVTRHRELLTTEEFDRVTLSEDFVDVPSAPGGLLPTSGGPDTRATAELGLRLHPALTPPTLCAWLGPGGGGRSLVALFIELLRKAFAEVPKAEAVEETPSVVALMLSALAQLATTAAKGPQLPGSHERYFRSAAGVGLYLAIKLASDRVLREVKAPVALIHRIDAIFSPAALLGGRAQLSSGGSMVYGVDLSCGAELLDEGFRRLSERQEPEAVERVLTSSLSRDEDAARRCEGAVVQAILRARTQSLATRAASGALDGEGARLALELCLRPGKLLSTLGDEKRRRELSKELARQASTQPDPLVKEQLTRLSGVLKAFKDSAPSVSIGVTREAARGQFCRAALGAASDLWLERQLTGCRRAIEARTGSESEGGTEAEYASGRLYRVALGETPFLKSTSVPSMGHLFVDVKDFTRRTALLGQATMAEFLRREFYVPILAAARRHHGGMGHLGDGGGIVVNNLLGDAVSISGRIDGLVGLAADIRRHLASYARSLAQAVSSDTTTRAMREIEEEFERRLRSLPAGGSAEAVQAERKAALARAQGEQLEAGIFVSYGPAPMVVTIDDDLFGRSRVAIAERINESARGTARARGARDRADALLAKAHEENPGCQHAWAVFVGAPFSLQLPFAAEEEARLHMRRGEVQLALRALARPVRDSLEGAVKAERPGDIYNGGAALSGEALRAYLAATAKERVYRRLEIEVASLHEEIRRRYFFPEVTLQLIVGYRPHGEMVELFRYAGRVMFKGLEQGGGIGVWELASENGVANLFAHYHGADWFRRDGGHVNIEE